MNQTKKVFLVTAKNRKPYHLQNLKARYKEKFVYTSSLEDAELVLCIEEQALDTKAKQELLKAQELNIPISYFSTEMLPERTINKEFAKERNILSEEVGFAGEEL